MNVETMRRNRIRKLILEALAPGYPNPLDALILRQTLATVGYPMTGESLASYLAYLEERGYVVVEQKDDFEITLVKITADGLDVLDGRTSDVGVGVQ